MLNVSPSAVPGQASYDEEREQHLRKMLSTVAHDLKTPLASVIGSLEVFSVMHEKLPPAKQVELIRVALQEARRLDTLMTNVLDMARLEAGVIKPKAEQIEVGAMLNAFLAQKTTGLPGDAVAVRETHNLKASIDPVLLGRAVGLVIDNAMKYGGQPPSIDIEYGKDAGGYIRIRDNGEGIPADQLEAIFGKYTRLEHKGQKNFTAIGLGLTIARETMRLLGGDIQAANHPDGGAVFTLRFPLH